MLSNPEKIATFKAAEGTLIIVLYCYLNFLCTNFCGRNILWVKVSRG